MRPVDRELPASRASQSTQRDASAPRDRPGRCRDTSAARRAAQRAHRRARSRLPWRRRRGAPGRARTARESFGRMRSPSASTKSASLTSTSITARSPSIFRPVEVSALRSHDNTSVSSGIFIGQPGSMDRLQSFRSGQKAIPQHGQAEGGAGLHQTRSRCRLKASCALILPSTRSRFISSTVPAATQT